MVFRGAGGISVAEILAPHVLRFAGQPAPGARVLDVGCGNGYWAARFAAMGCTAVGIDPSASGIDIARQAHPGVRYERMDASEHMLADLDEEPFDLVISTEVVEHLYDPAEWARGCYDALKPGGKLIGSTPYHGWLKNVAIAVSGKSDSHHDAMRVGGHIKFFSNRTLRLLFANAGFSNVEIAGAGRLPLLWFGAVFCAER
jgi:2-polyprenyl-3-methyl-5-hydroxy-6-metoxy-1,4-benzoquinol methylase